MTEKNYVFGVDLGGTACKIGLFTADGTLLQKFQQPTDASDAGTHIASDICSALARCMEENNISRQQVLGIGMGVPSPVTAQGVAVLSVNLGWDSYDIQGQIRRLSGLPAFVGNDVNVACLGESWKGKAAGCRNVVMITLGTGVGGGIVIDGHPVTGFLGGTGELGQTIVDEGETEPDAYGRQGWLEQYVSATGVARMAAGMLKESTAPSCLRQWETPDARQIFDAAKAGDALALEVVERFGKILGRALANIACVVNPELILIGGGLSAAGPIVTDTVKKYFFSNLLPLYRATRLELAGLGNDAGIYGACRLVLNAREEGR